MWLKRILKQSNYGTGSGGSGGAGGDIGVGSDFATGALPGQGNLFDQRGSPESSAASREKMYNAKKRRQQRKMLERKRKWRSLKDQQ